MPNNDIETRIKTAVERLTPDAFDAIAAKCEGQRGVFMIQPARKMRSFARAVGALAAALVMVFGGAFAYNLVESGRVDSLVMLDVNPSLEIRLNKNDRVLGVEAKNDDAVRVLDNMDLKNTHIDVAVNALIGSMLKFGYIHENANSVLLSVEGADHEKSVLLQRNLTQSISAHLNAANGAVISQALSDDEALRALADENQISFGKAALVQKILNENGHLAFADLARLSVNELNLLVGSKGIQAQGLEAQGSASDAGYIGEESALKAAIAHAGVQEDSIAGARVEMDYDDGAIVYDVEFLFGNIEYEYEINAKDGGVAEYSKEGSDEIHRREEPGPSSAPQQNQTDEFIGEDAAKEIAANHAGIAPDAGMSAELDKDDGRYIYEVEFDSGGREYGYDIDAFTGEIVSWEEDD